MTQVPGIRVFRHFFLTSSAEKLLLGRGRGWDGRGADEVAAARAAGEHPADGPRGVVGLQKITSN